MDPTQVNQSGHSMRSVAFAGGGSGGHINAALAIAEELRQQAPAIRLTFCISDRLVDSAVLATSDIADDADLIVQTLLHSGHARRHPIQFCQRLLQAVRLCREQFLRIRPDVVVGVGGFASAPAVLAARRLKIPVVQVEQNCIPGRTTRWLSYLAERTCTGLPVDGPHGRSLRRSQRTGVPLRNPGRRRSPNGLSRVAEGRACNDRPILVILGGSQGAQRLNDLLLNAVRMCPQILQGWQVLHQTGVTEVERIKIAWESVDADASVVPFIDDVDQAIQKSELVVSRAGAMTISEICRAGRPAILIPLGLSADQHQQANAKHMLQSGAAAIIDETNTDAAGQLQRMLQALLNDRCERRAMAKMAEKLATPDAAADIVELILRTAAGTIQGSFTPSDWTTDTRDVA